MSTDDRQSSIQSYRDSKSRSSNRADVISDTQPRVSNSNPNRNQNQNTIGSTMYKKTLPMSRHQQLYYLDMKPIKKTAGNGNFIKHISSDRSNERNDLSLECRKTEGTVSANRVTRIG